jgi:formyl-CoA transferase
MKELAADESLRKSGSIVEVPHPKLGKYLTVGSPIKFSDMTVDIKPSPLLGEHTDEILSELGYSSEKIGELHAAQAV